MKKKTPLKATKARVDSEPDRGHTSPMVPAAPLPAEIVFGLVYAVGTDYKPILAALHDALDPFGYRHIDVRLSDSLTELKGFGANRKLKPEAKRINAFMEAGNRVRKSVKRNDAVVQLGLANIYGSRKSGSTPKGPNAYIIYSLKHPDEVLTLRRIYGAGFFLIGVHASEEDRIQFLTKQNDIPQDEALKLIERDKDEHLSHGQQTRSTFALSDFFVKKDGAADLVRFVDLVFGSPTITPTIEEYSMFNAYAASSRSGDLSRQVGAAISSAKGDIIAIGTNDVPRAGGGLYWPDDKDDARDIIKKYDSNHLEREKIKSQILKKLDGSLSVAKLRTIEEVLEKSSLFDIIEFGRAVHAEMEALMSSVRRGISVLDATLYSTTFPCHMCAKHLIAAGVHEIVYIEPYSKSRAIDLHDDAMEFEYVHVADHKKVALRHFIGVGPRRYFDLFSLKLSSGYVVKREQHGKMIAWEREKATPRIPLVPVSYLQLEAGAAESAMKSLKSFLPRLATQKTGRITAGKRRGAKE